MLLNFTSRYEQEMNLDCAHPSYVLEFVPGFACGDFFVPIIEGSFKFSTLLR